MRAVSTLTAKKRGAPQYRQAMTAFPPPPAGQGGVMMLVRNRPPPPRVIRHDRLYKTCAAIPARYNSSQDTGLSNLPGYAPMQYDRCGMTAAPGRRFDESYGNNGNYEIYEFSAPPR